MHSFAIASDSQTGGRAQSPGYVLLLASIAAISGFLFGFDTAVINGVLFFLRLQFHLSAFQTETAASALLLGCLVGAASASLIGDRAGRKKSLIFSALLFAISSVATALANTIVLFCIGRLVGGVAIGLASVLTPVYIAEIAPARNRGTLVAMNQLAIVVGILSAYLVSWKMAVLGENSWRWMLGVAAIPSLAFFFGLLGIPESPRWLITHSRRTQGEAVLARIFGTAEARTQVVLVEQAAAQEDGSWKEVFAPQMRRPLGIAITLAVLCQLTGINTVLYYGSIIISEHFHGQSTGSALAANVIIGATNLVCTLIAMACLDRWGRRTMLLTGTAGMTLALATMVCALRMSNVSPLVVLGSVILYTGFFAFAMGPIPWIIIAEIFPNKIRGRAASIATSTLWTGTLVVTFTFLSLVRRFDISGTFAIYAVLSLVSFMYIWRRVPETRGKTLEEIQQNWQRKEMNRG
jgi:SP family arabinose:H+ symporter-like MFS transporter